VGHHVQKIKKQHLMPIKHAILLLHAIDDDPALREQMYYCNNPGEVMSFLNSKGYNFNIDEFEDAARILHLKCQSYEEADFLLQKADWLRFQILTNEHT
jgi:hypothetical protein